MSVQSVVEWARQPNAPVRPSALALANGVRVVWTPYSGTVSQKAAYRFGRSGLGAGSATDNAFQVGKDAAVQKAASAFAVVLIDVGAGYSGASATRLIGTRGTAEGDGNRRGWEISADGGTFQDWVLQALNSSGRSSVVIWSSSAIPAAGDLQLAIIEVSRDASNSYGTIYSSINGGAFSSGSGTVTGVPFGDDTGSNYLEVCGKMAGTATTDTVSIVLAAWGVGATSAAFREALRRNPWRLASGRSIWVPVSVPASGGTALDASVSSQASLSAALSTSIQAAASLQAVVAIAAAMSTSIQAVASMQTQATLSAGLTTSIAPAASLQSQVSITADLSTGAAEWASAPAAMSTIAASLSTSIQAAAALSAQSSLSGTLTNEALFESASGFKISKLPYDPRLPLGSDARALQSRLYEVLRQVATVANAHDDGYVSAVVNVSGNYTVQRGDSVILVDASAGAATISLQSPAEAMHKTVSVRKIDGSANSVAVVPPSGKVDGASTLVLTLASPKVTLASSGGSYYSV